MNSIVFIVLTPLLIISCESKSLPKEYYNYSDGSSKAAGHLLDGKKKGTWVTYDTTSDPEPSNTITTGCLMTKRKISVRETYSFNRLLKNHENC